MSVKTIFKVLIGTIVIITLSSVIIELFNVNTSGVMINQYIQLAADQSCILYTQETYRKGSSSGATSETQIFAADGTSYSGAAGNFHNFYGPISNTPEMIWKNIYGTNNAEFRQEMNELYSVVSANIASTYPGGTVEVMFPELASLKYMADAQGNPYTGSSIEFSGDLWNVSETDPAYVSYLNYNRANTYMQNLYTPVNIGIPYIDKTVANRMFKWNLTQLLSNCNSGNILQDEYGEYYVNFKGFAVYTQQAEITNFTYHVCDLNTDAGKQKLKEMTGIDADGKAHIPNDGLKLKDLGTISEIAANQTKISNNIVIVVEVDYRVPVAYRGITPIKEIFNYFMNRDTDLVAGRNGVSSGRTAEEFVVDNSQYIDSSQSLGYDASTGGNSGNGKLSIGKLYYTLVR